MLKATAVALTILAGFDHVAYGGQYLTSVFKVLAAIERAIG